MSPFVTRLLLVRHGQSTWNAERRWQGSADPPLSEIGRAQARALATALADQGIDAIVSSDLSRALETADIAAAKLGLGAPVIEPRFRERDVGEWSGLNVEEIEHRWPGLLAKWRAGTVVSMPGGEDDITPRVTSALFELAAHPPGRRVLVVTHGGVIGAIDRHFGVPYQRVGNITGRWFEADATGSVTPGELFVGGDETETSTTVVL